MPSLVGDAYHTCVIHFVRMGVGIQIHEHNTQDPSCHRKHNYNNIMRTQRSGPGLLHKYIWTRRGRGATDSLLLDLSSRRCTLAEARRLTGPCCWLPSWWRWRRWSGEPDELGRTARAGGGGGAVGGCLLSDQRQHLVTKTST